MAFPSTPVNGQHHWTSDGREYIYTTSSATWDAVFSETLTNPKNNTTITSAPTATDDSTQGYIIGSLWVDPSTRDVFRLVDDTPGAAVWRYQDNSVSATPPASPLPGQSYYNTTDGFTYIYNGSAWVDITASGGSGITNNMAATVPPVVTDDTSAGYVVGSRWVDVTANRSYICVNSNTGAAVWREIGKQLFPPVAVDPLSPMVGDTWYNTATNLYKGFDTIVKTFTVV